MIAKVAYWITGKDDVERVAARGDVGQLNTLLETRRLLIPRRPGRFLDAATFSQQELMDLMQEEASLLSGQDFDAWVMEVDGFNRLPAFSRPCRMQAFSNHISQTTNKVFSLGCVEILLKDIVIHFGVDFVDLNPFSRQSWEIDCRKITLATD